MKWLLSFLLAAIVIISCKDKKAAEKVTDQASNSVADPAKDSAEIRTVITTFYNWYDGNYAKLMKYDLYSGTKKEDAPPYKINWDQVEKYQQFIRDSIPQLGTTFLANQKRFFEQCDSAFKKDVEDDIPYGFDYDWYTNSQEDPQYLVNNINGARYWIINVDGDNATVHVKSNHPEEEEAIVIKLVMNKEGGKWKIAKTWSE